MPRKKKRTYGKYIEELGGVLYASVNLPLGNGKYKKKRVLYESIGGTPREALKWALNALDKHKNEIPGSRDKITFEKAAAWYKKKYLVAPVYENGYKVEGVKDYVRLGAKADRIIEHFGTRKIKDFTEDDFIDYAKHRRRIDKVKVATINRDLALLRKMLRAWHKKKWIAEVPELPFNMQAENERDRVMSFEEEKLILSFCTKFETITKKRCGTEYETTIEAKREHLKPIIILAVDTAMRSGEIFKLVWNDVDFKNNLITVQFFNAKTEKSRKIGMTPRVRKELDILFESSDRKPQTKVFKLKGVYRSFQTACDRADIKDLNFHDLRHTATTRMIRAGIPHTEVMKITGHTQIKTFLRYLNLGDSTVQNAANLLSDFTENQ